MRTNKKPASLVTHEGARARNITLRAQLRRSVLSCLLWESEFYEEGEEIGKRIANLTSQCMPEDVAGLAVEAREQMHLRHVPLLLLRELARHPLIKDRPQLLSKTMGRVLQRADEPAEFLALYWKEKKQPLSKQVKRGLAWSLRRFSEYELAKYNRDSEITPRDVLFLSHAKPKDEAQAALWKKLAAKELATPDTWEVQLSAGADKKETFERLISEKKLGYFALIRNLRNMEQAGVDVLEHQPDAQRLVQRPHPGHVHRVGEQPEVREQRRHRLQLVADHPVDQVREVRHRDEPAGLRRKDRLGLPGGRAVQVGGCGQGAVMVAERGQQHVVVGQFGQNAGAEGLL